MKLTVDENLIYGVFKENYRGEKFLLERKLFTKKGSIAWLRRFDELSWWQSLFIRDSVWLERYTRKRWIQVVHGAYWKTFDKFTYEYDHAYLGFIRDDMAQLFKLSNHGYIYLSCTLVFITKGGLTGIIDYPIPTSGTLVFSKMEDLLRQGCYFPQRQEQEITAYSNDLPNAALRLLPTRCLKIPSIVPRSLQ